MTRPLIYPKMVSNQENEILTTRLYKITSRLQKKATQNDPPLTVSQKN